MEVDAALRLGWVALEEGVEPGDAVAPYLLVGLQEGLNPLQGVGIGVDEAFTAVLSLRHQPGSFQHGYVLLHGGE